MKSEGFKFPDMHPRDKKREEKVAKYEVLLQRMVKRRKIVVVIQQRR